jgi:hypothetical protein
VACEQAALRHHFGMVCIVEKRVIMDVKIGKALAFPMEKRIKNQGDVNRRHPFLRWL